ncbi:hypothetical protein NM208_g3387 [Fusarium decemcellulare]|uniref:Uncharacterized protein n=1 Tax=Fusarium decemcellulare TaxID=57161 RepID=A0ACC1SPD8_9HYPO|nr:hypothetical protein NM208_g3387 [Fusarium decemcellulare]
MICSPVTPEDIRLPLPQRIAFESCDRPRHRSGPPSSGILARVAFFSILLSAHNATSSWIKSYLTVVVVKEGVKSIRGSTTNITTSFAKDINISTHDNLTRGTPTSDLAAMATNTARTPAATRVSPTSSSSGISATICVHKAKLANVAALTEFYDISLGSHDVSAFRKAVEDAKSELDVVNKRLVKAKFEAQNLELEESNARKVYVVTKDGVQEGGLRSKLFAEVGDPRVSAAVMGAKWVGKDIYAFHGDILQRQADAEVELVLAEKAVDVASTRLRRLEANLAVKDIYEKMWEKIDECHKLLDTVKRLRDSGDIESCLDLLASPKAT